MIVNDRSRTSTPQLMIAQLCNFHICASCPAPPLSINLFDLFHSNVTSQLTKIIINCMIQLHAQQTIREQKRSGIKSVREYFSRSIFIPNQLEESTKTSKNRRLFTFWSEGEPIIGCLVHWLTSMPNVKHNEYLKNMKIVHFKINIQKRSSFKGG